MSICDVEFRGKRSDDGKWVYGYFAFAGGNPSIYNDKKSLDKHGNHWAGVIGNTVGQYIGNRDKKGVKIFAGDIVEGTDEKTGEAYRGYVLCEELCWSIARGINVMPLSSFSIAVIGNIYDNIELLGGGSEN